MPLRGPGHLRSKASGRLRGPVTYEPRLPLACGERVTLQESSASVLLRDPGHLRAKASTRLRRAGHFLLLVQEKVTKEKHTLTLRFSGSCPKSPRQRPGSAEGTSMYPAESARSRADPDGPDRPLPPQREGAQKRRASCAPKQSIRLYRCSSFAFRLSPFAFRFCAQERAAVGSPLHCGGSGRDARRGGAMDRADSAACTWMCNRRNTGRGRGLFGQEARKAQCLGCISFGYFSLCKQRKVTRAAKPRGSPGFKVTRSPQASGSSPLCSRNKGTGFPPSRE